MHKSNIAKLNHLVSTHKNTPVSKPKVTVSESKPISSNDSEATAPNTYGTKDTQPAPVSVQVSSTSATAVKASNSAPPWRKLETGSGDTRINTSQDPRQSDNREVLVANFAEPVKLRPEASKVSPVKRLSVSEARNLFESGAGDSANVKRVASRGSLHRDADDTTRPPSWINSKADDRTIQSASDVSKRPAPSNLNGDLKSSSSVKDSMDAKRTNDKPFGFAPKVGKAWGNAKANGAIKTEVKPSSDSKSTPQSTKVKSAVSTISVTPKQAIVSNKPLPSSNDGGNLSKDTKVVTKVNLRASDAADTMPARAAQDLVIKDIKSIPVASGIESSQAATAADDDAAPNRFPVQLKPAADRTTRSAHAPKKLTHAAITGNTGSTILLLSMRRVFVVFRLSSISCCFE